MIDLSKKLVLIHPPRCGGTSLETALTGRNIWKEAPEEKHLNARQTLELITSRGEKATDYAWYGLKRNPMDRIISMYHRKYWSHEYPYGLFFWPSFSKFAATVRPLQHESNNLSLSDFHSAEFSYEIIDMKDINHFLETRFNILKAEVLQSVTYKHENDNIAICIIEARFDRDYSVFGYSKLNPFGKLSPLIGYTLYYYFQAIGSLLIILRLVTLSLEKLFFRK